MGFDNGWQVIERADQCLRNLRAEEDERRLKKGKGRARDVEAEEYNLEQRDTLDRTRSLLFDVGDLDDGFDRIAQRIRFENAANTPLVFRIVLDLNALIYRAYQAARETVDSKYQLREEATRLCYERLRCWLTYSACQTYRSSVPQGCQVEIEIHADHACLREKKKESVLMARYEEEAIKMAKKVLAEALEQHVENKKATSARRRRERKRELATKKKDRTSSIGAESGPVLSGVDVMESSYEAVPPDSRSEGSEGKGGGQAEDVETRIDKAMVKVKEQAKETPGDFQFPAPDSLKSTDQVIKLLYTEIRREATLVTARAEADDSIVARSQKPDTFKDRRISMSTRRSESLTDDHMSIDDNDSGNGSIGRACSPPIPSISAQQTKRVTIVVSTDCDYIYQLDSSDTRFVMGPYKRGEQDRFRMIDILALHEAPREIWPFENVYSTCGATVMVSKEKGPKVERLGILSLVKNEKIVQLLNELEQIINFVDRHEHETRSDSMDIDEEEGAESANEQGVGGNEESMEENEEQEQGWEAKDIERVRFRCLQGTFSDNKQLDVAIRKLYNAAGLKAGPAVTIQEFVGFVKAMLCEPQDDSNLISKEQVIHQMARETAIETLGQLEKTSLTGRTHRNHPLSDSQTLRGPRRRVRRKPMVDSMLVSQDAPAEPARSDESHQPDDAPSPSPSKLAGHNRRQSKRLSLFAVRRYQETFSMRDGIMDDIKKQQQIDTRNGTTAKAPSRSQYKPQPPKQKYTKKEVDTGVKREREIDPSVLQGVGIKLEGFSLRCVSEVPFTKALFNKIVIADTTQLNLRDDNSRFELLASARKRAQDTQWLFRSMSTVGRIATFEMVELLDAVMRTTSVHEPGFLHTFTESADGVPKIGVALHAVLKALDVDNKRQPSGPNPSNEALDTFFATYDKGNKAVRRDVYSNAHERSTSKQAIINLKITKQELDTFLKICNKNQQTCIAMLFIAKYIKWSKTDFAPLVKDVRFYQANLPVVGTNVVVASRTYASKWSKHAAQFVVAKGAQFEDIVSYLPFAHDLETLTQTLPSLPSLSRSAIALFEELENGLDRDEAPYNLIHTALVTAFKAINISSPVTLPDLAHELSSILRTYGSRLGRLFDTSWQPASLGEINPVQGIDEVVRRLVDVTKVVGELAVRGLREEIEHAQVVEKVQEELDASAEEAKKAIAEEESRKTQESKDGGNDSELGSDLNKTAEKEAGEGDDEDGSEKEDDREKRRQKSQKKQATPGNKEKAKTSTKLENLKTIGDWESTTEQGKDEGSKAADEVEDDMEGTVKGGVGAQQLRTFARRWDSAFGRPSVHQKPQGAHLNTSIILHFIRPQVKKGGDKYGKNAPLVHYMCTLIKRCSDAIKEMNQIKFDKAAEVEETIPTTSTVSPEMRRARTSAGDFIKRTCRMTHSNPKRSETCKTDWEHLEPQGLSFLDFSGRYQLLRPRSDKEDSITEILLPGIHNCGLVSFSSGKPSPIAEIELAPPLVKAFSKACADLFALFSAPYSTIDSIKSSTAFGKLVAHNAHDHLQTIFDLKLNSRLLYDALYVKDEQVQFFCQDLRRATSQGIALFRRFGVDAQAPWTQSIPQLLSKKKKKYTGTVKEQAKKQFNEPDLQFATSSANWSTLKVIRPVRRDSFSWKRRDAKGKAQPETLRDKNTQEFMLVSVRPTFRLDEDQETISWYNEDLWLRGRRQDPVQYDDGFPLSLPPEGPPEGLSPTSRRVRAMHEAKGCRGELTPKDTKHTVISLDPGIVYPLAVYVSQLDQSEGVFATVSSGALKHDMRMASRIRAELGNHVTGKRVSKNFTGQSGHMMTDLFSRCTVSPLLGRGESILAPPNQAVTAPPVPFLSATSLSPALRMAYLNTAATLIPSALVYPLLIQIPAERSHFNFVHERRVKARQQSQAAHAANLLVPRQERRSHTHTQEQKDPETSGPNRGVHSRFEDQTAAVVLGAGSGKTKCWGMGYGSKMVKCFANAIKARHDLRKVYRLIVNEAYTSQLCPKCKGPLIYATRSSSATYSPIYRIEQCIRCQEFWHRDRVGAMNLIDNLFSHSLLRKNMRAPEFSKALNRGPRLSAANATDTLTRAWYKIGNKNQMGNTPEAKRRRFEDMVEKEEAAVVAERAKAQAQKEKEKTSRATEDVGEGGVEELDDSGRA